MTPIWLALGICAWLLGGYGTLVLLAEQRRIRWGWGAAGVLVLWPLVLVVWGLIALLDKGDQ